MINLPQNTAKILQRLKTDSDDKAEALAMRIATKVEITRWTNERWLADLKVIEIPQKTNDHIANKRCKWNKELHKFLETN
jgi:predicted XRE-type DNA-binding protein